MKQPSAFPGGAPVRRRHTANGSRGIHRRQAILTALERLLESRPFGEITVADISERAGVGRPSFYFYFTSKHAALAALLSDVIRDAGTTVRPSLGPGPDEPLRQFVVRVLHHLRGIFDAHRGVLSACAVERHVNADVATVVDGKMSAAATLLRAAAKRTAGHSADTNALVGLLMTATVAAVTGEGLSGASCDDWDTTSQVLADLWIDSLADASASGT